jgi:hypothetical protein
MLGLLTGLAGSTACGMASGSSSRATRNMTVCLTVVFCFMTMSGLTVASLRLWSRAEYVAHGIEMLHAVHGAAIRVKSQYWILLKTPCSLKSTAPYQKRLKNVRSKMPHKRSSRSGWTILVVFSTVHF